MKKFKILFIIVMVAAIFTSCQKEPSAKFTSSKVSANVNETIIFSNSSKDADNYEWEFGDGQTSTTENPTHSYSSAGTFSVKLTAFSKNGKKEDDATGIITIIDTKLEITVIEYVYPYDNYIEDIDVVVYTSYTDWYNEENDVGSGYTDSNGEITFSGCQAINYYIEGAGYDDYNDWYDNDGMYVETGTLTEGETKTFTAYVEYDSTRKSYKFVKLVKTDGMHNEITAK